MQQVSVKNLAAESGGEYVDDTAAHTGDWMAMLVVTDTVLGAANPVVQPAITNYAALDGASLSAGFVLYGNITSITLASGIVQMINTPLSKNRNGA